MKLAMLAGSLIGNPPNPLFHTIPVARSIQLAMNEFDMFVATLS